MDLELAKGVNDTDPENKIVELRVMDTLRTVFELYGYAPLDTPILERYDVLAAKYAGGSEILKETFTLTDQGKRKLGLRYDLTVPFARYVGMHKNLKLPFKRYQMGRAFRDGPIKLGRYREFWQCDIDSVGISSMKLDAELISIFHDVFSRLGLDIIVKVNNRKILDAIMEKAKVSNASEAILVIDKLEKIGVEGVRKELKEKKLSAKSIDIILRLISISGSNEKKIKLLREELGTCAGLDELEEITRYTNEFTFDVSLARGLAYYTGTIYEVFLRKGELKSSLGSGGRYDTMIGSFLGSNETYPAVGISFGLSAICDALPTMGVKTATKVYVIPITVDCTALIKHLRTAGINTDSDYSGRNLSANLRYASSLGIPYVLIVGSKEMKENKYTLRNMETGKEELLTLNDLTKRLLP